MWAVKLCHDNVLVHQTVLTKSIDHYSRRALQKCTFLLNPETSTPQFFTYAICSKTHGVDATDEGPSDALTSVKKCILRDPRHWQRFWVQRVSAIGCVGACACACVPECERQLPSISSVQSKCDDCLASLSKSLHHWSSSAVVSSLCAAATVIRSCRADNGGKITHTSR